MPYTVHYDADCRTLYTALNGVVDFATVASWEAELYGAIRAIPEGSAFQVIDDLRGYEVADQALPVHREMRLVTPRFLAAHGFVVGFFRLYDETAPAASEPRVCTRVVHLHHDAHKMERYRELLGSDDESFFTDVDAARDWLSRA